MNASRNNMSYDLTIEDAFTFLRRGRTVTDVYNSLPLFQSTWDRAR